MQLLEQPSASASQIDCLLFGIVGPDNGAPIPASSAAGSGWEPVLRLLETWEDTPADLEDLEDDGVETPTSAVLKSARSFAEDLRSRGIEAPAVAVPNGDGGLVLRWKDGASPWTLEFEDDGFIESYLTVGGKVRCRHGLQAAA